MITTFLVEHPWLTTMALVLAVTVGPPVGYWLIERPRLALSLGALSLLPVVALTLVPTDRDLAVGCVAEWSLPSLGAVELMANVVLFVPPALLIGVALRRPLLVLIAASVTSALVEALQAFATALGRSCSTNDWLFNTVGAAVGSAIAAAALGTRRTVGRRRTTPARTERSPGHR